MPAIVRVDIALQLSETKCRSLVRQLGGNKAKKDVSLHEVCSCHSVIVDDSSITLLSFFSVMCVKI